MIDFSNTSQFLRFVYHRKPLSMPPDNRLSWRLPVLLLSIDAVRGKKATFKQIALLTYALNNSENRASLEQYLERSTAVSEVPIRFEPGLPYLLQIAVQRGLLTVTKTERYALSISAQEAIAEIQELELFLPELTFLDRFAKRITDAEANRILTLEITLDA